MLPLLTPAISNGITCPPSSATIQRMGRINRGPVFPPVQYIDLGHCKPRMKAGSDAARRSTAARPALCLRYAKYSPLGVVMVARSSTVTPIFLAKPCAAPAPPDLGGPEIS